MKKYDLMMNPLNCAFGISPSNFMDRENDQPALLGTKQFSDIFDDGKMDESFTVWILLPYVKTHKTEESKLRSPMVHLQL